MSDCASGVSIIDCTPGVPDCCALDVHVGLQGLHEDLTCSAYNGKFVDPAKQTWLLLVAFSTMALMSFGIGANDAANSWGTSVGSGAVTLTQAVVTGGLMDWLGATLLGAGVSDTIHNVSNVYGEDCWACGFCDSKITFFMLGMCAALLATAVFLLLSSTTGMPVSTTHAIIGAVVGMALVGTSPHCLDWARLASVAITWVTSPLLAGLFGACLHFSLHRAIMAAPGTSPHHPSPLKSPQCAGDLNLGACADADQRAMSACPWLFGVTMSCVSALILLKSPLTVSLSLPVNAGITVLIFIVTVALAHYYIVPMIQWRSMSSQVDLRVHELEMKTMVDVAPDGNGPVTTGTSLGTALAASGGGGPPEPASGSVESDSSPRRRQQEANESLQGEPSPVLSKQSSGTPGLEEVDTGGHEHHSEQQQRALAVFKYLLVFVAALESFAHGANDTANATGAFSAVWATYNNGLKSCDLGVTPIWIMALGGLFVFLGVFVAGARVIKTMGQGLADINFFRGFCIELGSAMAVVSATVMGIPVSTTHCQVGAVVFVGCAAFGFKSVRWSTFGWIALTWLITLPSAAGLAAVLLALSKGLIVS